MASLPKYPYTLPYPNTAGAISTSGSATWSDPCPVRSNFPDDSTFNRALYDWLVRQQGVVNTGINTTYPVYQPSPPKKPSEEYYEKLCEDLSKALSGAQKTIQKLANKVAKAKPEAEKYAQLVAWLKLNHPEVLEERRIAMKAMERFGLDKEG